MAGSIDYLPAIDPDDDPREGSAGPDHPMRRVTRETAFEGGWTRERAGKVAALFDDLASDWHTRDSDERAACVEDALVRGQAGGTRCLEVGSGTGFGTRSLAKHFDTVLALDISGEMLRRAPAELGARLRADASSLPLADGSVDTIALVNALLFPDEVARVLRADGRVLWVNTSGIHTPIHLPAEDVLAALPGQWRGRASQHGTGIWCVAQRV